MYDCLPGETFTRKRCKIMAITILASTYAILCPRHRRGPIQRYEREREDVSVSKESQIVHPQETPVGSASFPVSCEHQRDVDAKLPALKAMNLKGEGAGSSVSHRSGLNLAASGHKLGRKWRNELMTTGRAEKQSKQQTIPTMWS